ncbi:FAD-dependent oxidoreductase [Streptomyces sp. NPDC013953]|uniref:FAD-dependent oxidoreductase n=1 Tax=Streptomyces sp. NPDC013953 TaxID=3364868 RepID=UPI0036F5CD34
MRNAVIAGGGVAGLATALALSATGCRVVILERSARPPQWSVGESAGRWVRPTVPQASHSHTLTSLGVTLLRARAPQVLSAARATGAKELDLTLAVPPGATDRDREPGDDDLVALACRRTSFELVLYRAVRDLPGVLIQHDTTVRGVELDPAGRRVRAVVTDRGERVPADLVVDATGHRAMARTWLSRAGVPVGDDVTSPSGLAGYSRFYRLTGDGGYPGPVNRGNAAGDIWDHYAGVLHPADNDTFSIALATLPGDHALAGLRTRAGFTALARATPGLGPWLEPGVSEPISPVFAITSPPNALRWAATQCRVAGLFTVGDAACVTNPLFGRGMSLALAHAFLLADELARHPAVGPAQSRAVARAAEALHRPWYDHAAAADRDRITRWRAAVQGTPAPSATPVPSAAPASSAGPAAAPRSADPDRPPTSAEIAAAARSDGVVWRGLTRMLMSLTTPAELLGDEKFVTRVRQAPAPSAPGRTAPSRDELVALVAAAERSRP